jgi:hypothetical protein
MLRPKLNISYLDLSPQSSAILPANFVAFLIASAGAFTPKNDMLLNGLDGEYTRTVTIQAFRFADAILSLPMMLFQGMGTPAPFNSLLAPSLIPVALLGDGAGKWLSFLICSGLVFLTTYTLGRALGMHRGVSLLAAWILPPLCLPYQSWINLYLTSSLNPLAGDTISMTMLLLALLARGYVSPRPGWVALAVLAIVIWLFLANPLWIMILMPTVLFVGAGIMASHVQETGFVRRTVALVLPSAAFALCGGAAYLLGLYADTATSFFSEEMNQELGHSWRFSTVAMVWDQGLDPIGAPWVALAAIGLALVSFRERGTLRAVALSICAVLVFQSAYIAAYWLSSSWVLPKPIYFEFALWPFYALFAAYAVAEGAAFVVRTVSYHNLTLVKRLMCVTLTPWQYASLWMIFGTVLCVLLAGNPFVIRPNDFILPAANTTITKTLHAESGIASDAKFKGYVANLTDFQGPDGPPTDWYAVFRNGHNAILAFGNMHRLAHLWRYDIPTFEAYTQSIEPALYIVTTRLLNRPVDRQHRNITLVTQANFPVLESLGVRFLITDYLLPEPSRLAVKLATPSKTHYLFELPNPNFGDYSPTEAIVARDATDVLQHLVGPSFDFRKTVVLSEPLDLALQPAESKKMTFVRGGWRVQARSRGASLLLLPLQYNSCLSVDEFKQPGGKVIAVRRANLVSTALIFEGEIDVKLSTHLSPFRNAYCRLRDASELKSYGLSNVPKNITAVAEKAY